MGAPLRMSGPAMSGRSAQSRAEAQPAWQLPMMAGLPDPGCLRTTSSMNRSSASTTCLSVWPGMGSV